MPGTRELLVFPPYVIVYEIMDDEVVILRVWHGAQDRG
ncbi:type II toxin-antitoxin system RelE/ParE family toxin [Nitrospirillum sp. BR 11752]|nr:type II toxin-antitoxin system RelE/ParE family toxin [Nitrospirillum sp. BR 11752]